MTVEQLPHHHRQEHRKHLSRDDDCHGGGGVRGAGAGRVGEDIRAEEVQRRRVDQP